MTVHEWLLLALVAALALRVVLLLGELGALRRREQVILDVLRRTIVRQWDLYERMDTIEGRRRGRVARQDKARRN